MMRRMKRTVIAAAWIAGSTIPLLVATVFVFGCCVLPFHGLIHRAMPFCHMATVVMSHHNDTQPPMPAREKQEPVKRFFTEVPRAFVMISADEPRITTRTSAARYRSFITLGATRCDRDVGWHVVLATFLI